MNENPLECYYAFNLLKKRKSILLTLFDTKNNEILNEGAQAPSPSKDYCQLILTNDRVIYRRWKISIRSGDSAMRWPVEVKDAYNDFIENDLVQREIASVFGKGTLDFIINVIEQGKLDYLSRMPENILLKIVSCLPLEDIARFSQTNSLFRQLCRSDKVWIELYKKHYTSEITKELMKLAERDGWRKLFFTNKIKLKLELRRQAKGRVTNLADSVYFTPRMRGETKDNNKFRRSVKSAVRGSTTNLEDFNMPSDNRIRFTAFLTEN